MDYLFSVVLAVHILAAIGVIGLVLVQHGKGADMGAAFGSGASGSLFGATGSANFLSRATAVLATVFFCDQHVACLSGFEQTKNDWQCDAGCGKLQACFSAACEWR
jgi:protein translocase SecG subunit